MSDAVRYGGSRGRAGLRLCAVLWALPAWGCFSTHGPQGSTETGNPPVIDSRRLALKVSAEGAHIVGEKGAVTPGGAAIEITNLTTGMVTKANASADGSFDVKVDGSLNDAFAVGGSVGTAKSVTVYVVRGSAAVGAGTDGALSCQQREELAAAQLARVEETAAAGCATDQDCEVLSVPVSCRRPCGTYVVASAAGNGQVHAASVAIDSGLCASYTKDGCQNMQGDGFCSATPVAMCTGGQCVRASASQQGSLSCQDRELMAGQQITQAVQTADTSCTVDADCATASTATACTDACGPAVVSRAGQTVIDAAVTSIDQALCSTYTADGCKVLALPCDGPISQSTVCMNGQCMLRAAPSVGPIDCTSCLGETIEWGNNGGGFSVDDRSTLEPCVHYTHRRIAKTDLVGDQTLMSCENEFTACTAVTSSGAVLAALANADVQQALASSPVTYGDDQALDAPTFEIKVGARVVNVAVPCSGNRPSCIPPPGGVQALVDLLQAIDQAELATAACGTFLSECNLAFDAGSGGAATQGRAFWHDPASQACLPRIYNGSAGNANRFDTQAACEAHCGTPASAAACAWNRTWLSVCTGCSGLQSTCISSAQACAWPCASDSECASDSIGLTCNANHVCEAGSCPP